MQPQIHPRDPEAAVAIFEEALTKRSDAERARFLEQITSGSPRFRARLELMLEGHFQAGKFLACERQITADPRLAFDLSGPSEKAPLQHMIGPYKLLEKIGEGGWGVVYQAEQTQPFRRQVALKVIKAGLDTEKVMARFEMERQALALMEHPNIARVLEAGSTDEGRPFFVMELVSGEKITAHCNQMKLPIHGRVELFIQVCHAVQHAHQKGVIHRDLKPSNILVTLQGDLALPKIIDFGVAKATRHQAFLDNTAFTAFPQFIGTPAYMSPEQAEMASQDLDTRSDIYSLGVLLYELLTGRTPFDSSELLQLGFDEMRRAIREREPTPPSERLLKLCDAELMSIAELRQVEPSKLVRQIRGDLDWIVTNCLEKDRSRRYETAHALALDLQRFLNGEVVLARPPTLTYQIQKFIRRNKVIFAASASVALTLIAGVTIASWQAIRATRAEKREAFHRELAERRLKAALKYAEDVSSRDVGLELWTLIGAARISQALTTNTVQLIGELQATEEDSPQFRQILGRLHVHLALKLGWSRGNSKWDPEAGYKAALEAVDLLRTVPEQKFPDETIYYLALAEQIAGATALAIDRPDDALRHFNEMGRWASMITNLSSWPGNEGRRMEAASRVSPGAVLLRKGWAGDALSNYFLPHLREVQAIGIDPKSRYTLASGPLAQAHKAVAKALAKLGRHEEALSHCRDALPYYKMLIDRGPNNAEFANDYTVMVGHLGEAHLALNQPEGLDRLNEALESARQLAARDPNNTGFILTEINVLQHFVQGFTAWALHSSATETERRERLDQAQTQLETADALIARLPTESGRNAIRALLEPARIALVTAKNNGADQNR